MLTDTLPVGSTFASATLDPVAQDGGTLTFDLGDLASGESMTLTIVATPKVAGTLSSSASVSATDGPDDPDTDNNSESVNATVNPAPAADLEIELSSSADSVGVGDRLTYTIHVTNRGPSATLAGVTDTLPDGVRVASATGGATPDEGRF